MMEEIMEQSGRIDASYVLARAGLLTDHAQDLSELQEACARHLATFPSSLRRAGEIALQRHAIHWQGVDWMPWRLLGAAWMLPQDSQRDIALANAFTAMHMHIQREAVSNGSQQGCDMLSLGSLLYTQALCQYQKLFPEASQFWRLLEGFHLEWTETMQWEGQWQWATVRRYTREDILRLSGARALLKISSSAVALLAGKQRVIMPLSSVLDQMHVAIQLADGLINWQADLRARKTTYFLAEVAAALKAREMAALGQMDLKTYLSTSPLPVKVIKRALNHLLSAQEIASRLQAPDLISYLGDLHAAFQELPQQLDFDLVESPALLMQASISAWF